MEALLFGSAATAAAPATMGLLGAGGSFAWLPTVMTAGTAMSAIGSMQQGQAAKAAAGYNAAMMEQNATVERQQAGAREDAQRRQARQVLGAQRAAFAQSGGGMGGSAADVMGQSAMNAELDALTLRYEGDLRARGMESQAASERYSGRSSAMAGYMGAAGSILSGAARYGEYSENRRFREEQMRRMS